MSTESPDWGTPKPGRKSEKRQRSAVISVRCSATELQQLQELAELRGMTISRFLREHGLTAPYVVSHAPVPAREDQK